MQRRQIGHSDLAIAPIMLGGNVFGWTADRARSFAILDVFVEQGFNAIDTADQYSIWAPGHVGGESETVIGEWLKARGGRSNLVIATKVGKDLGHGHKGLSAAHIVRSVEGSLKRLQTDYIDLYQSHHDDAEVPLEETLEAHHSLVKAGKVRAVGASNYSPARLREALEISRAKGVSRYECLQPHFNLYDRAEFEDGLQQLCREQKIGVITYFSLANGFLTGKYRSEQDLSKSARGSVGWIDRFLNARGFRILAALDKVAAEQGVTQCQVALAWLIAQPSVTAPIVSATKIEQLTDILGAARLVLSQDQLAELTSASAPVEKVESLQA